MDVVLGPFLQVLLMVIDLYIWVIIISVILSWLVSFNVVNTQNRFVYMVGDLTYRLTEPALGRIRRLMPNLGGLDISPIVLIIGLFFIQGVIRNLAMRVG
jgi:YggT family protein